MTNVTGNLTNIQNWNLPVKTNDTNVGNETNTTYWRLEIPLNVGGNCNGTIEFRATQTT